MFWLYSPSCFFGLCFSAKFIKQIEAATATKKYFFSFYVWYLLYLVGGICGTLPRLLCVEVYPKKGVYIFFIKREGLVKSANRLDLINGVGHSGDRIDNWVYFQRSGRNVQGPNTYKLHLEISIISVTGTVVRGTSKNKEWC